MASRLVSWLASLPADRLAVLLRRRGEATAQPLPRDLAELADRLTDPTGVSTAYQQLSLPAVQLVETLVGVGSPTRTALLQLLHTSAAELDGVLQTLTDAALVWPSGDRYEVTPTLRHLQYPLGLGAPAAEVLGGMSLADLRAIAASIGLPAKLRKAEVLDALVDFLGHPERVRALVDTAPRRVRDVLVDVAVSGPLVSMEGDAIVTPQHWLASPVAWAVARGLLVPDGLLHAQMPREVTLALRGPQWRPRFDARPPMPDTVPAAPAAVERQAAAAASSAVAQLGALVAACAKEPIALLKAGGVGARELRRVARAIGMTGPDAADTARLWLELAVQALLLAEDGAVMAPTAAWDAFTAMRPGEQLAVLLQAWWELPAASLISPAARVNEDVGPPGVPAGLPVIAALRRAMVQAVSEVPDGRAIAAVEDLVPVLEWRMPLLRVALDETVDCLGPLWMEAQLLGVVGLGALSGFGRALLAGDLPAVADAGHRMLGAASGTAIFQADLTAVVAGTPSAELTDLLDSAADRESRGAASTWRFSSASVRRALDAGTTAEALGAALRAASSTGALPQALAYLLTDVARRHGRVRVRTVGCVLHAADPALLAEIAATRALAKLHLSVLAPTVLASRASPADTLAALRNAGYAPVGENADGTPVLTRVVQHRAVPQPAPRRGGRRSTQVPGAAADAVTLATKLLNTPVPTKKPAANGVAGTLATVSRWAGGLTASERRMLAYAIDGGHPVTIKYVNAQGGRTTRVIEPAALQGDALVAWCRLRDDERMFLLERIESVAPA